MTIGQIIHESENFELLRLNLDYHKSIGVDYFLICVRDAQPSVFQEIQEMFSCEEVFVFPLNIHGKSKDDPMLKNRRMYPYWKMQELFNPDCIFFVDTDEFWITQSGSLKENVVAYESDVLQVNRYNALVEKSELSELNTLLFDKSKRDQVLIVEKPPMKTLEDFQQFQLPWILKRVGPKVFLRSKNYSAISQGFHAIPEVQDAIIPENLLILHIPFTGLSTFENKIKQIKIHLKRIGHTFPKSNAGHWKYWATLKNEAAIEEEFNRQFLSSQQKEELLSEGIICHVNDYFIRNNHIKSYSLSKPLVASGPILNNTSRVDRLGTKLLDLLRYINGFIFKK